MPKVAKIALLKLSFAFKKVILSQKIFIKKTPFKNDYLICSYSASAF